MRGENVLFISKIFEFYLIRTLLNTIEIWLKTRYPYPEKSKMKSWRNSFFRTCTAALRKFRMSLTVLQEVVRHLSSNLINNKKLSWKTKILCYCFPIRYSWLGAVYNSGMAGSYPQVKPWFTPVYSIPIDVTYLILINVTWPDITYNP